MTMQDPINMYKRERHDTSSSVNANLYVSKVEDTIYKNVQMFR